MSRIWKYECPSQGEFSLRMPEGAKVISVHAQNEKPCIWAIVDPEKPIENRRFCLHGTGHLVTLGVDQFIGTVMLEGGALVVHLFEAA